MSAATGGNVGGGSDDLVDRRLTEHRDHVARLRAAATEPRRADAPRPSPSPSPSPMAAAAGAEPDRAAAAPLPAPGGEATRELADRLLADAATAARLLNEYERRFQALDAGEARPAPGNGRWSGPDELSRARAEALDLRSQRDRAVAEVGALASEVAALRGEVERLSAAAAPPAPDRLPVLASDVGRWSEAPPAAPRPTAVATPVGPPPLPPSLDDVAAVERFVDTVRRLIHLPPREGRSFHELFDNDRYHAFHARLREANLLAERLINEVERSRDNKELLWHLMLARKNDEIHRKKR